VVRGIDQNIQLNAGLFALVQLNVNDRLAVVAASDVRFLEPDILGCTPVVGTRIDADSPCDKIIAGKVLTWGGQHVRDNERLGVLCGGGENHRHVLHVFVNEPPLGGVWSGLIASVTGTNPDWRPANDAIDIPP